MNVEIDENKIMNVIFDGKLLVDSDLKNSDIDSNITNYSQDQFIREKYYDKLGSFLSSLDQPVLIDSRGALPPYIVYAKDAGKRVMQILLKSDSTSAWARYYDRAVEQSIESDPMYQETEESMNNLFEHFLTDVVERNRDDIKIAEKHKMGLITHDTAIVDTSDLSINDVYVSVLSYLDKVL